MLAQCIKLKSDGLRLIHEHRTNQDVVGGLRPHDLLEVVVILLALRNDRLHREGHRLLGLCLVEVLNRRLVIAEVDFAAPTVCIQGRQREQRLVVILDYLGSFEFFKELLI